MATTTNYGWTTPDDTDLVKDGAAAIRTLGSSADTTVKNLNPGTTAGDVDYYTSGTAKARLAIGTAGQVLTVNAGATAPEWASPGGAGFVGCRLTKSSSQSISSSTVTAITWDTETFDTDGFHSTVTNTSRITIPAGKAGKYLVVGIGGFSENATGTRSMYLYKNGSLVIYPIAQKAPDNIDPQYSWSTIQSLAEGDYIEFYVVQSSGGNRDFPRSTYGTTGAEFSVQFLGA